MQITPLSGALGAEITGVDLANLDAATGAAIKDAFHEHLVLVFPDQDVPPAAQVSFTELFGPVEPHPLKTRATVDGFPHVLIIENKPGKPGAPNDYWHSDISHAEMPPAVSVLHALKIPGDGRGDTMFCNMVKAFDGLSETLRDTLTGMRALHSGQATYKRSLGHSDARRINPNEVKPPRAHPIVRTHPETGRAALFVNPHFTLRINELTEQESDALLKLLFEQTHVPEYQFRLRWKPGTMVLWDNASTQHYAANDYYPNRRRMERVAVMGDKPY